MLFWGLALLVVMAGYATFALMRPSKAKRLRPADFQAITEVAEKEEVKVRGIVRTETTLRAPYTGRECVYYKLHIVQDQAQQRTDFIDERRRDFWIEDDSGSADIVVEGATFEIVSDYVEMERASRLSEYARELALKRGWEFDEIAQITISEGIVSVGALVEVVGMPVRVPAKEAGSTERGYRDLPETVPVFSAPTIVGEVREPIYLVVAPAGP